MNTVICLDLETTSRAPKENEIVEVGLVKVENNSICDTRTWCVKPEQSVPQFIYKLTGLTPKDIETAPNFKNIAEDIINFIGNHTIVAHNASFDINQLNKSLTDYGFHTLKNEVIDTQDLSKILFPTIKSYKQGQLCHALGIQQQTLHRALDDAIGVAELYITLMKEVPKLKPQYKI